MVDLCLEPVLFCQMRDQIVEMMIFKPDHLFALGAYKVMVRNFLSYFVKNSAADFRFGSKIHFAEKFQDAVNGRLVYRWRLVCNGVVYVNRRCVTLMARQRIQYHLSLRRYAVTLLTYKF